MQSARPMSPAAANAARKAREASKVLAGAAVPAPAEAASATVAPGIYFPKQNINFLMKCR